jgi:hypothetical protein
MPLSIHTAKGLGPLLPGGPQMGLYGLGAANARLDDAMSPDQPLAGYAPVETALAEALFWIAALDNHFQGVDPTAYFRRRKRDDRGRTVAGLIYARNRAGHGLEVAVLLHRSISVGTDGELTGAVELTWAPLADLPKRPDPRDRDELYDQHVAGKPLPEPLKVALAWFEAIGDPNDAKVASHELRASNARRLYAERARGRGDP